MTVEYVSWQQFAMFSSPSTAYTEDTIYMRDQTSRERW